MKKENVETSLLWLCEQEEPILPAQLQIALMNSIKISHWIEIAGLINELQKATFDFDKSSILVPCTFDFLF